MNCLNCAVYLEIKRNTKKFCSDKCRVYFSRSLGRSSFGNAIVLPPPDFKKLEENVPDWAKDILKPKEVVEEIVEEKEETQYIQDL